MVLSHSSIPHKTIGKSTRVATLGFEEKLTTQDVYLEHRETIYI